MTSDRQNGQTVADNKGKALANGPRRASEHAAIVWPGGDTLQCAPALQAPQIDDRTSSS